MSPQRLSNQSIGGPVQKKCIPANQSSIMTPSLYINKLIGPRKKQESRNGSKNLLVEDTKMHFYCR